MLITKIKHMIGDSQEDQYRQKIIQMTKHPLMTEFTGEKIVERLTEKDLIKIDKIMKKHPTFNITTFLRIFRNMLKPNSEEDFYLTYGLFRLFQEICIACKHHEVTFRDISSIITEKMPTFSQEIRFSQKLYPLSLQVPQNIKKKITAPEVIGKVLEERERLQENLYLFDKFIHINRRVGQSFYSPSNKMFITVDFPSTDIMLLDRQFQLLRKIRTEQELSKRDAIVTHIAWSEHQQRLAALLGNYSLSLWAMEDNFRFEVNVPLPLNLLITPYTMVGYMQSSRIWYTIDNRPSIYILSSSNYEPESTFTHFKMIKEREQEKMITLELKYRKLLCLAFQKNIFLISLEKRELITQLKNFSTTVTSIAFSETYQALFVSNFQNNFYSFELTEHLDLTLKGKFQGHKHHITLLGILENRPVVYSIDQKGVAKLWDVRDFTCYQSFILLKNIEFRQSLALPEGVCFIGSKHFCYRWQRFRSFLDAQRIVYISTLQKNILLTTSKEVRVYSHNNGVLVRVLKGIFSNSAIVKARLIEIRKTLLLMNEQGLTKFYSTHDFTVIGTFEMPPKPLLIYYEKETELLSLVCMGEVRITEFKDMAELPLKRRIHNRLQMVQFCEIAPEHDMIIIQYSSSPYLIFYSYQRAKLLGFIMLQDLIVARFTPFKNILFLLCKNKLFVYTYSKNVNAISFCLNSCCQLWQSSQIKQNNILFYLKPFSKIQSTDMIIFDNKVLVTSNDACFQCIITLDLSRLSSQQVKINREYYNPYRIASQDFLQSFDPQKASSIKQELIVGLILGKQYLKFPGNRHFVMLAQINAFYCIADENEVIFYDQLFQRRGIIDFKQTLPLVWGLHNYSEEEFKELEFVLEFIQHEATSDPDEDYLYVTSATNKSSASKNQKGEVITMKMLRSSTTQLKGVKSMSLREKKMVLEKERDERQKQENFQEARKVEEMAKLTNMGQSNTEKYFSESIAFLNVNRNKLLLAKGAPQMQLPQIRALEFKLNALMNRDDKKSIVSRYSGGQEPGPMRQIAQDQIKKTVAYASGEKRLLPQSQQRESYKDHLKRLDLSLRQSKYKRAQRSGSLPSIRNA